MNPWWLRPPADDSSNLEPDRNSSKSASGQKQSKGATGSQPSSSSNDNDRRRRVPRSNGRPKASSPRKAPSPSKRERHDRRIGLFCDIEDIVLGLRKAGSRDFDVQMVLRGLLEKGSLVVRRGYADWGRFRDLKRRYHEAGFELIDVPRKYHSGKSSCDIKLAVDAIDLSYSKHHVDTFAIMSGDADLCPLVSKLRENGKYVIGIGIEGSASKRLVECCDQYLHPQDLVPGLTNQGDSNDLSAQRQEAFSIVVEAVRSLMQENRDRIWGSMIKQTIQRNQPAFSEAVYGYSTFSDLLEDAQTCKVIRLERDDRSGSYVVTDFREI